MTRIFRRLGVPFTWSLSLLLFYSLPVLAIGLSSPVIEVRAEQVKPGQPLRLKPKGSGGGLLLENTGTESLEVEIRILAPGADQLRPTAEPIPDPAWLLIKPNQFLLRAGESRVCRMELLVPRDARWRGRYYQAMIWSRGTVKQANGSRLSAGLLSRVLFRTVP